MTAEWEPRLRPEAEVIAEFRALALQVKQIAPGCEGSAAERRLRQRIEALGWVLGHPKIERLLLTDAQRQLLECLY